MSISPAFQSFAKEAPQQYAAWFQAVTELDKASALDAKTQSLVYIGILAAMRLEGGLAFHVQEAKAHGASRNEIIGAVLAGVPAVGNCATKALPAVLQSYDND